MSDGLLILNHPAINGFWKPRPDAEVMTQCGSTTARTRNIGRWGNMGFFYDEGSTLCLTGPSFLASAAQTGRISKRTHRRIHTLYLCVILYVKRTWSPAKLSSWSGLHLACSPAARSASVLLLLPTTPHFDPATASLPSCTAPPVRSLPQCRPRLDYTDAAFRNTKANYGAGRSERNTQATEGGHASSIDSA